MSNATQTIDPRLWLQPSGVPRGAPGGTYYWSFLSPEDDAKLTAFEQSNPTLKALRTEGAFILFQNVGSAPVLWGLSGFPSVAPKGAATTAADVESMPPPEPGILETGGLVDSILHAESLAGQLLLYGGVGVVLLILYQHLSKEKKANPEKDLSEKDTERAPRFLSHPVRPSDDRDFRAPRSRSPHSTLTSYS